MKDHEEPVPDSDDDIRAENEVLKLKLEMDHGMKGFGSVLSPKAENAWLKSVYDMEDLLKASRSITIYELIGKPSIKRWYNLKPDKIVIELQRVLTLLDKSGITLNKLETIDDMTYYRLLTEEFLPTKLCDLGKGPFLPPVIAWFDPSSSPGG